MDQLFGDALSIVTAAGDRAAELMRTARVHYTKQNDDLVTDGDLAVESMVADFMQSRYPDHGLNFEERGVIRPDADYVWVLDPVDGTKYYARRLPLYSVSLAIEHRGRGLHAIVYFPELKQVYTATAGQGAFLNGNPIRCSSVMRTDEALVCLEIPARQAPEEDQRRALAMMGRLMRDTCRVRIIGVSTFSVCSTAMGGFDAYINLGNSWKYCDIAAGQIIMRESGGVFEIEGRRIVAGNPRIVDEIKSAIRSIERE